MTLSAMFVLFVLPLSLLLLGGLAVFVQKWINRESTNTIGSPTPTASAEIELHLAELLKRSSDDGVALTIHDKSGRVQGVLLTLEDYKLLTAVPGSRIKSNRPERFRGIGMIVLNSRSLFVIFGTALTYTIVNWIIPAPEYHDVLNKPLLLLCLVFVLILTYLLRDRHPNPPVA